MKKLFKKISKKLGVGWDWINGHKTKIGGVMTSAVLILSGTVDMNPNLVAGLLTFSGTVLGGGAIHKGIKNKEIIKEKINSAKSAFKNKIK